MENDANCDCSISLEYWGLNASRRQTFVPVFDPDSLSYILTDNSNPWYNNLFGNAQSCNSNTNIPFKNKYKTPKTLGVDRIGLVSSAVYRYPNENVLVIDAGTCITYDYVNTKAQYFGGSISPGIIMRYKALNNFTAKLPMLDLEFPESLIGISTNQSIHSGVIFGVLGEINAIINRYKDQNEKLTVVLTGGDANFLAKRLKNGIFANPNFLLEGLNAILNYNS